MNLWIVTKEGVYRHDIVGVFTDERVARGAARTAIEAEPDDYHRFDVTLMSLGEPGEHLVCRYKRTDARIRKKRADGTMALTIGESEVTIEEFERG